MVMVLLLRLRRQPEKYKYIASHFIGLYFGEKGRKKLNQNATVKIFPNALKYACNNEFSS